MKANIRRRHLVFYGRVQGVGFRYHAYHAAQRVGATGWVRNCYDGTVEAEVQGTPDMIADFLTMLYQGRNIEIEDLDEKDIPVREETCFQIVD